jgi:hypothetical protein
MIPVPVMVATVAESVAILATAAAAQPSKSAEICASVAHWPMRSLILVAISISLKPAPAPTIRNHSSDRTQTLIQDPVETIRGESSPQFENVHPKEEGNQEIAAIGSPTKSIKLFQKTLPRKEMHRPMSETS